MKLEVTYTSEPRTSDNSSFNRVCQDSYPIKMMQAYRALQKGYAETVPHCRRATKIVRPGRWSAQARCSCGAHSRGTPSVGFTRWFDPMRLGRIIPKQSTGNSVR